MGFWRKMNLGWKGVRERCLREKLKCLKNGHICQIKLKTSDFRGLDSSEPVAKKSRKGPLKLKSFREKLLVVNKAWDSRETLYVILWKIQFLPKKKISQEVFSREVLVRQ